MKNLHQFKLHPSVIYSIIREQAGSPEKALSELVMNSIDAKASEIHITINATEFTIRDNGIGFKNLDEINDFFGTFGTPHQRGDATYGQFRIGRGQIFALAETKWRSGHFGMSVNLGNLSNTDAHGYELSTFDDHFEGCEISGTFYEPLNKISGISTPLIFDKQLSDDMEAYSKIEPLRVFDHRGFIYNMIKYFCMVEVPVYLNGVLVSQSLSRTKTTEFIETDTARISLVEKGLNNTIFLNQGVFVCSTSSTFSPLGFIVDLKQSPNLNMARNQIQVDCPIYRQANLDLNQWVYQLSEGKNALANKINKIFATELERNSSFIYLYTVEQFKKILKRTKAFLVSANGIEESNILDVLERSNSEDLYLNTHYQGYGFKKRVLDILPEVLANQNSKGKLIVDAYGLLRVIKRYSPSSGIYTEYNHIADTLNIKYRYLAHQWFDSFHNLDAENYVKIPAVRAQSKVVSSPIEEIYAVGFKYMSVKRPNLKMMDLFENARAYIEKELNSLKARILKDMEYLNMDLDDELIKKMNAPIIPMIYTQDASYTNRHVESVKVDDTYYIKLQFKRIKKMDLNDDLIHLLLSTFDSSNELESSKDEFTYAEFNKQLHEAMLDGEFDYVYSELNKIALKASELIASPLSLTQNQRREAKNTLDVWSKIISQNSYLQNNSAISELEKSSKSLG